MIDDRLREELGALLDGALPDEQAAALRARLETDAELRREYEELERTVAAVRGLPRAGAPVDLRVDLRAGIRARLADAAPVHETPVHRGWFTMPRFAAAAAVLVAASIVIYSVKDRDPAVVREAEQARAPTVEKPADLDSGLGAKREEAVRNEARDKVEPGTLAETYDDAAAPDAPAADAGAPAAEDKLKAKKIEAKAPGKRLAEGAKDEAAEGVANFDNIDLVRLAETDRTKLVANRVAYLEQLSRLPKEKVQSHVFTFTQAADAKRPVLHLNTVTIDAGNAVEATRIAGVLRGWTAVEAKAKDLRAARSRPTFAAGAASGDASTAIMSATLRATPAEMQRIATWLTFVSVPAPAGAKEMPPAPGVGPREAGGGGEKSRGATKKSVGRAKGAAPREYRVVIRYPQPPPAAPETDKR